MANFYPYFLANSTFDQLPKMNWQILAVDQNFKITQNDINKKVILKFQSTEKIKWNPNKWSFPYERLEITVTNFKGS
jgi:hypothetical protein